MDRVPHVFPSPQDDWLSHTPHSEQNHNLDTLGHRPPSSDPVSPSTIEAAAIDRELASPLMMDV